MADYTPGPWGVKRGFEVWVMAGLLHVATIPRAPDGDWSMGNANLIAATPDMLEAAKKARKDLKRIKILAEWCHDSPLSLMNYIQEGLPSIIASVEALDAAIAKAECRL